MPLDESTTPENESTEPAGAPEEGSELHLPKLPAKKSLKLDEEKIVRSVLERYDRDIIDRLEWMEMRLQRYAKLRGWLEPKNYPWPNASNAHVPLIMTDSLRTQDTLHNAVLAVRPVMSAISLRPQDANKGELVDNLLDYQLFIEQTGEEKVGDLIDGFVNDGMFIAFIPWVKEDRTIIDIRTIADAPVDGPMQPQLIKAMRDIYSPHAIIKPLDDHGFKWKVTDIDVDDDKVYTDTVEFWDDCGRIQMYTERKVRAFDGPCIIPKAIEDVVVPTRACNLQPPGPSNPSGAQHAILVDYPTYDEIRRLVDNGTYDLVDAETLEKIEAMQPKYPFESGGIEPIKQQKDAFAGQYYSHIDANSPKIYTRLMVFDRYDANGDGLEEDVIFWVIKEARCLVRARYLTELYPSDPPRRPLAEARFLPVPGQFYGIGLPELLEHVHDTMKILFDQTIDNGTLTNMPFFFYRAASGTRPEIIRMSPGDGYPVGSPKDDVQFPTMSNANQTFGMNMITMLSQIAERLTLQGELQLGRVPYGKASALRTASGMQTILQQGDARPERILRRFFRGMSEVYRQMHELNMAFLPPGKRFRLIGVHGKDDPYKVIDDPAAIRGRFQFDFKANVLNTNKAAHAETMQQLAGVLVNGLMFQLGIVTPDKVYTIIRELVKSLGQDPEKFLEKPKGMPDVPNIMAEEAISDIIDGTHPMGMPAEGALAHQQKLLAFANSDEFGYLSQGQHLIFVNYLRDITMIAQKEQQQAKLAELATAFQQMKPQQPMAGPAPASGPSNNPPVAGNELLNESLPGAGGGAAGAANANA